VRIRKAVIPAAGLGTRFLPATKAIPKEMIPLVDKPGIQYVVEEAVRAGLTDILIISGRTKRAIEDHFDRLPALEAELEKSGKLDQVEELRAISELAHVHCIRQPEPRGLGHAVGMARWHVGDEPFAVLLPDDLMAADSDLLVRMVAACERLDAPVVALKRFGSPEISAYGVVTPAGEVDADGLVRIATTVEKPAPEEAASDLAIMGRYVLTPDLFDRIERLTPGAGGELQLTDALRAAAEEKALYGLVFDTGRYDTGNKLDWLRATVELALVHPQVGPGFRDALAEIARREGILDR
jgi:UTP--glucose-1-phosphate uridylyltransferase